MTPTYIRQTTIVLIGLMSLIVLPWAAVAQTVEIAADEDGERRVTVVRSHGDAPHVMAYSMGHRAYLGVNLLDLTPELRQHFGVAEDEGVMVSRVEPEGPAAAAGLVAGDILIAIDGQGVQSTMEIVHAVGSAGEGEVIDLQVIRDGQLQVLSATLAERQRPEVDISRWAWKSAGDDGEFDFQFICGDEDEDCPEVLEIDPELMDNAMSNLEVHLKSPHFQERMIQFHEGNEELETRLKELEKHLEELQRQLRELEK